MICDDCLLKNCCYWNGKANFIDCEMKRTDSIDTSKASTPEEAQIYEKHGGCNE